MERAQPAGPSVIRYMGNKSAVIAPIRSSAAASSPFVTGPSTSGGYRRSPATASSVSCGFAARSACATAGRSAINRLCRALARNA